MYLHIFDLDVLRIVEMYASSAGLLMTCSQVIVVEHHRGFNPWEENRFTRHCARTVPLQNLRRWGTMEELQCLEKYLATNYTTL